MIARMLRLAGSLILYFALATLIAEAIIVGYCWSTWHVDRNRLVQAVAVARGVDLASVQDQPKAPPEEASREQPSYQQIVQARALRLRHLELREQALKSTLEQLRTEQQTLADQQARYQKQREQYESQLAEAEKGSQSAGLEQTRAIMAKMAPRQAKELLFQMLKKNEMDDVVALLRDMPDAGRAKILKEFKASEETEKLDEVLRQIRQGVPQSALAKRAQQQLKQNQQEGPTGP